MFAKRVPPRCADHRATASLLGMLFAATGCSVGPNFTPPHATVADKWRGAGNARVTAQTAADGLWWKSFNDPALDRLIELAYRQNVPLQIRACGSSRRAPSSRSRPGGSFRRRRRCSAAAEAVGLTEQVARYTGLGRNVLSYQIGFDAAWSSRAHPCSWSSRWC
jgi:hypothetical protein